MKERIIGIDVARALAVIGMIIVNFKIVLGNSGASWLKSVAEVFDGKAAATFVVLAGLGIALMTNTAIRNKNNEKLKVARKRVLKRALFLFAVGLSYIVIWPADILHYYGIYLFIVAMLLTRTSKTIITVAIGFIFAFPVLMLFWDYGSEWDFTTFEYTGFWTLNGFTKNLLFNGFHPVIPWSAFILFGFWFGKQNLNNNAFVKKSFWVSSMVFIVIQLVSKLSATLCAESSTETTKQLAELLSTNPMPPLPMYMFNGVSFAIAIISACILIAKRFSSNPIIDALNKTGQLALTFYVAHIVLGMGILEAVYPNKFGYFSLEFSIGYALAFSLSCMVFAVIWRKYKTSGPLEWIMRKVTD